MKKEESRLRWPTLVLLWVWALLVFVVVDLFRNVPEFDAIRPRNDLYRGMRVAAHRMVGEPYGGEEIEHVVRYTPDPARRLTAELEAVGTMTPHALRALARQAHDLRVRNAALRELAKRFPVEGRADLHSCLADATQPLKVRREAARLLAATGPTAEADLERVLDADLPHVVRGGAVLGLGELGTASAARRLLELADPRLRADALRAIASITNIEAAPLLREAALASQRPAETRRSACRALWRMKEPATVETLSTVLADTAIPPEVRAMAADSLGRLGNPDALTVVAAAANDSAPRVARQARLAKTRLSHVR